MPQLTDEIGISGRRFDYAFGYRFARAIITPFIVAFPFLPVVLPMGLDYIKWKAFGAHRVIYVLSPAQLLFSSPLQVLLLIAFGMGWLSMIGLAVRYVIWHSPIVVSQEKIYQYIYGIRLRSISLIEVERIEKTRKFHTGLHFHYDEIKITKGKCKINFRNYIEDYDCLRGIINKLIKIRLIPVEFVDLGVDSIQALPTKFERKQAQKFGIRRAIAEI